MPFSIKIKDKNRLAWLLIGVLGVAVIIIWVPLLTAARTPMLTVAFLDVGQGDAIFITTPSGRHMLVDGGRGGAVLKALGAVMPFWDRNIDVVVATHPDADHIGGLAGVFNRFAVGTFVQSDVTHSTSITRALLKAVANDKGVHEITARRGEVFDFGDGVRATILFPDRPLTDVDSNTASVVVRITFGTQSFLLTGDSPQKIERYLVSMDEKGLASDVLKAGHHGSKTASNPLFIGDVAPTYTVLSRGCHNRYGHPHKITLETLHFFKTKIEDTCPKGTIVFTTDGTTLWMKTQK